MNGNHPVVRLTLGAVVAWSAFSCPVPAGAAPAAKKQAARFERLLRDLDHLISDGERRGSARPEFLHDLKQAVARARRSKRRILLLEHFADGELSHNPPWQILQGSFHVDSSQRLYSSVAMAADSGPESPGGDTGSANSDLRLFFDLARTLAGESRPKNDRRKKLAERAIIYSRVTIPYHFDMRYTYRSDSGGGTLALGLFQGRNIDSGYRLLHHADTLREKNLELVRLLGGGRRTLASAHVMTPGVGHAVRWRRTMSGWMTVLVDGREMVRFHDSKNTKPFTGLTIINEGGEHVVDDIEVRSRE